MTELSRSNVAGIVEETTAGTLRDLTGASDFIPLREGFTITGAFNNVTSDELKAGDIGQSKSFNTDETPSSSLNIYMRHSGVEGQEPETGLLFEAVLGDKTVNATEYVVAAGTTLSKIVVANGSLFEVGQGLLIKDVTNGYSVRTIASISTNDLNLNYQLTAIPANGTGLGKAVLYKPGTAHPTFSLHRYQAASSSAFKDAVAGCRVNNLTIDLPANDLAQGTFGIEGIEYFYNPIRITAATNDKLDFNDGGGEENATISAGVYKTPMELAREIETKMNALTTDTITVTYSSTTGKFTIASDGATLSLLWNTGANTATTIGTSIGFLVAADDTGALTYTSDNALTYNPGYTPSYDDSSAIVIKGAQLLIGDSTSTQCRKASTASFTLATPVTRAASICAETGIDSTLINSRECTLTSTIILEEHEAEMFDKFFNNTSTQLQFVAGTKSAGNREAGKTFAITFLNCTLTSNTVNQAEGYHVVEVTAQGFVGTASSDCYINFL